MSRIRILSVPPSKHRCVLPATEYGWVVGRVGTVVECEECGSVWQVASPERRYPQQSVMNRWVRLNWWATYWYKRKANRSPYQDVDGGATGGDASAAVEEAAYASDLAAPSVNPIERVNCPHCGEWFLHEEQPDSPVPEHVE